jgi:serine protease
VVKFHDQVQIPYEDGVEKVIQRLQLGPWDRLAKRFPGVTFKRMYTSVKPEKLRELIDRASQIDREYKPSNLLGYFVVECPPGVDPEELARELQSWPMVKKAYYDPPGDDPVVNPGDDPRSGNQGYLDPAPDGIDAEFAWGFVGGDGAGMGVIDMERGWTLNHEDLTSHGAALLHGVLLDTSRPHGTSVLGEICAVDNALGCVGICPNVASVNVVSYNGSTRPNAMAAAIAALSFGDVLLLEAQLSIPGWINMPIEVLDAEFDTISLATALGIVVVEAAGNGSNDLDTYVDGAGDAIFNRGAAGFRDSGAIMVGAGSSATPHTRLNFSNFGSRIDCYGWGENVDTCSSTSGGSTTNYTSFFNGTSSASPVVTGAALAVQGIAEASLSSRFSPLQLRAILSDPATGTPSNDPAVDRIGVMPDLRAIIEDVLNVATDVYIRDFVGDTGDPHAGSISASPDIILRPAAVADPQAEFGEGSGTENSNMLGFEAEAGQDNFIYVRVRNRGGSPATNVEATVYWSPPATLVTPDLWTLVDSVTIPNVPDGDILTVSDAITWPSAAIPAEGHYCFVGLVGTTNEPPPDPAEFVDFDNFMRFIRENNNVTWRNFNVVNNDPAASGGDPANFVALPFLAPGAPDKARPMRLEIVAKLPRGARVFLEAPPHFIDGMRVRPPFFEMQKRRVRIPIHPHGRFNLEEMLFPAKSRTKLRLLVQIPKQLRRNQYELYARQLYREQEVGRITWRLVPPEFLKQRER